MYIEPIKDIFIKKDQIWKDHFYVITLRYTLMSPFIYTDKPIINTYRKLNPFQLIQQKINKNECFIESSLVDSLQFDSSCFELRFLKDLQIRAIHFYDCLTLNIWWLRMKTFRQLRYLKIEVQNIKHCDSIKYCYDLEILILPHNQISTLRFLEKLNNLISVDLSNNTIEELNQLQYFRVQKRLQFLDLTGNIIIKQDKFQAIIQLTIPYQCMLTPQLNIYVKTEKQYIRINHKNKIDELCLMLKMIREIRKVNEYKKYLCNSIQNSWEQKLNQIHHIITHVEHVLK